MDDQRDGSPSKAMDQTTVRLANARAVEAHDSLSSKAISTVDTVLARIDGLSAAPDSPQQALSGEAFSIAAVCKKTSFGRTSIYSAIKNGQLIARKHGRRTIVLAEDLRAFLQRLPAAQRPPTSSSDAQ